MHKGKIIDHYEMRELIGSGQFGEVFKGFDKHSHREVAIKAMKRQYIKGKYLELMESQIKALKKCNNKNIIKLYDVKVTANNIYLILQYCNQGDLMAYLKKKRFLDEEQAMLFFTQILNAFKTIVQQKIIHRDLKLPNILMHNGEIKIADFGFAKILKADFTQTMLGTPSYMAPEVFKGDSYNTKADIWSIGICFYHLLFGETPYTANNLLSLAQQIQKKPLYFPKHKNQISEATEDVLRKMLNKNPQKRIEWQDLFEHPINNWLENKMKARIVECQLGDDCMEAKMSKLYLQNNHVIEHPKQISNKQNINKYVVNILKKNSKYQDEFIKKQRSRSKSPSYQFHQTKEKPIKTNPVLIYKDIERQQQAEKQKQIKAFKDNRNKLLHQRNIYALLASLGRQAFNQNSFQCKVIGYLLVKKMHDLLKELKIAMACKTQFQGMEYWQLFTKEKEYKDIRSYIETQSIIFDGLFDWVCLQIKNETKDWHPDLKCIYSHPNEPLDERLYEKTLSKYVSSFYIQMKYKTFHLENDEKKAFIYINRVIDCQKIKETFVFEKNGVVFDFRQYYNGPGRATIDHIKKDVQKKMSAF